MLEPVMASTSRTTLAAIQLIDRRGTIMTGRMAGSSYAHVPEVTEALRGRVRTVLGTTAPISAATRSNG
jgi:hypothetical protein